MTIKECPLNTDNFRHLDISTLGSDPFSTRTTVCYSSDTLSDALVTGL